MSNLTCFSRITEIHEDIPSQWIGSIIHHPNGSDPDVYLKNPIAEESPVGPEPMVSGVHEPVCIAGVSWSSK